MFISVEIWFKFISLNYNCFFHLFELKSSWKYDLSAYHSIMTVSYSISDWIKFISAEIWCECLSLNYGLFVFEVSE